MQNKATYNTSIVALKEAEGTLLADYGIVVAEPKLAVGTGTNTDRVERTGSADDPAMPRS